MIESQIAESGNLAKILARAGFQPDFRKGRIFAGAGVKFWYSPSNDICEPVMICVIYFGN